MTTPTVAASENSKSTSLLKTIGLFLVPLLLLFGVIGLFVFTSGAGLNVEPVAPLESVRFERTVLKPGAFELQIQNTSPQAITLAQINVNDSIVPFRANPGKTIPRLGSAVVTIPYPWVEANPYTIAVFSASSIPFVTTIEAAAETRNVEGNTLLSFTLIGLYVGVIPVFLGIFWFPVLRRLGARAFAFLMAVTVGLLLFLGIDATSEALETANGLGGPLQGVGLVGLGITGTFLLLEAISARQRQTGRNESQQRLNMAFMIAIGIGLHNFGEGLAIGASYSVGAAALGAFLVIGFIIQNITEGLGIIAPIVKDKPQWVNLVILGLIGGAPAIAGAWIGGLTYSPILAALFLAIGAGAVLQVAYQISKLILRDNTKHPMPFTLFSGVMTGMVVLYITGLIIK